MSNFPGACRVEFLGLLLTAFPTPLTLDPVTSRLRRLLPSLTELASLLDWHIRSSLRIKSPLNSHLHYTPKFRFVKGEHMFLTAYETPFSIGVVWTPMVQDLETEDVRFWNILIRYIRIYLFSCLCFSVHGKYYTKIFISCIHFMNSFIHNNRMH